MERKESIFRLRENVEVTWKSRSKNEGSQVKTSIPRGKTRKR